jgi:sphingosine kinase
MLDAVIGAASAWLSVSKEAAVLGLLAVLTFGVFVASDAFNIIEKMDLRLVRLYQVPARGSAVRGKRFLALVNPYSGRKDGLFQFHRVAYKLLMRAGASDVSLVKTTHAGHLHELGKEMARAALAGDGAGVPDGGVLIFGGDGSLCEYVNGLVDGASGGSMDLRDGKVRAVLQRVKLGLLPTGTANGLVASMGCLTTYQMIVQIIEGDAQLSNASSMDVNQVVYVDERDGKERRMVDLLCVNFGMVSDFDDLTERSWRWMGKLRMLVAPLFLILRHRTYKCRIALKPADLDQATLAHMARSFGYRDPAKLAPHPARKGWFVIEDDVIMATLTNAAWPANDYCLAPDLKFDDGFSALCVIRGHSSRLQLIRAFIGFGDGSAAKLPWIELYKVSGYEIEADEAGHFGVSGAELSGSKKLRVELFPSLAKILKS